MMKQLRRGVQIDRASYFRIGAFLELAIAAYELPATYWALFHIATWDMELALQNPAIMAGDSCGTPVAFLVPVTDARNITPLITNRYNLLRGDDFLRPPFSHLDSTVEDSFWFCHGMSRLGDYIQLSSLRAPDRASLSVGEANVIVT
jgi:hypothetical protein